MRRLQSKAIAVLSVAAVILAACGSSATTPKDPVGGVAVAFETAKSGGVLKQMDLITCLTTGGALGNSFSGLFGGLTGDAMAAAGISADDLSAAWKISFDDLKTTQTSLSGDTATVHVSVKVTSEVDAGRLRDLLKKYGATQGIVPDDATIDAAIQAKLGGQLKMSETIDKDISVVHQGDKWVACGSAFGIAAGATPAAAGDTTAPTQVAALTEAPTSLATTPSPDPTPTPSPTPSPLFATAITTGSQHACAIVAGGGGVMCWGSNRSGQLGDGTTTDGVVPVQVAGITDAAAVVADKSADFGRTCVIRVAGSVACWGNGRSGELGDTTPDSLTPVPVPGITDGVALAVGGAHACVLRSGGGVVCWGGNRSGELGDGTTTTSLAPIPVPGLADATAIAAGDSHTCALRAGGEVACWGYNLASGTEVTGSTPENVPGITDAIGVAAGAAHTCALLSGGGIMCWGNNERGQLGGVASVDGQVKPYSKAPLAVAGITDATAIVAGQYYTCAIRSDRRATCWGDNLYGQLGDGTNTASPTPVTVTALTDTKAIAAGERITCALGSTGAVTCWGAGPLGNGSMLSSTTPVAVWGP